MNRKQVEYFGRDVDAQETRGSGRFSGVEVAAFLGKLGHVDVRKLGCPDHIFDEILRRNAARRGFTPSGNQNQGDDRSDRVRDSIREFALAQYKPF